MHGAHCGPARRRGLTHPLCDSLMTNICMRSSGSMTPHAAEYAPQPKCNDTTVCTARLRFACLRHHAPSLACLSRGVDDAYTSSALDTSKQQLVLVTEPYPSSRPSSRRRAGKHRRGGVPCSLQFDTERTGEWVSRWDRTCIAAERAAAPVARPSPVRTGRPAEARVSRWTRGQQRCRQQR